MSALRRLVESAMLLIIVAPAVYAGLCLLGWAH
jgi:hypothetical protein